MLQGVLEEPGRLPLPYLDNPPLEVATSHLLLLPDMTTMDEE
jgi:hypothetical protein